MTPTDKYVTDDVRQGFTGYINDEETNLDYAQARMYRKELGRFTSADQIFLEMGRRSFPQSFNLFSYVRNNPLSFSDSTGLDVLVSCKTNGKTKAEVSSQQAACESGTSTNLNNRKSAQFKVVVKDGRLAIVGSVDRATLSDREKKLYDTITDSGPGSVRSTLNVFATSDSITFGRYDGPGANSVDLSDLEVFNKTGDKSISGEVIAHEIIEGTISASTLVDEGELNGKSMSDAVYERAHKQADKFFGGATIRADPVPDGASVQSREVTYHFSILNVDVRVNKTFDVKQPAASVNRPFEKLPGKIDRATIVPKSN
ncbi:MAG: RHS repeat-associated core domain-containing protein [Acidobacteria bacterium]|nr:RHS repeat-associated core domain-containing protein [Acidobacteriota bacterium]